VTRVTITRYNKQTDRWSLLGAVPADVFSEEMIQQRWGGGLFQCRFRNSAGHIIHTVKGFEIEEDPDRRPLAAPDVNTAAPAGLGAPALSGDNLFMTLILGELKSNRELMSEMIRGFSERSAAPAPQSDLVEMVKAFSMLHGILPKQSTPLPEKIIEKILEAGLAGTAAAPAQNEWVGLLKDVIVEFKPAIREALIQKGAPAVGVPRRAAAPAALPAAELLPAEEDDAEAVEVDATSQAVAWLKSQCAGGAKPAELVQVVLHFVAVDQLDLLLKKADEQIFSELADPELDEPSCRAWFESLFKELRAVRNLPNSIGASGDAPHVDADVRPGA
jgi:hypothetical protein